MRDVTLRLPDAIAIPKELALLQSVNLFWLNGEEVSLFRDAQGQIRAGGRPLGYRRLDSTPTTAKELEDLLKSLIANIIHPGFPTFERL